MYISVNNFEIKYILITQPDLILSRYCIKKMWLSTLSLIRYVYACIILYLACMLLKMYISVHGHAMFGVGEGTSSVSYLYCSGNIIAPKHCIVRAWIVAG